jgi:hypothetical protein
MNRVTLAVVLAIFASGFFHPGAARATNGSIIVERWTTVNQYTDTAGRHHFQIRRELLSLGTDGSLTPMANYGAYDFMKDPGQADDDTYAIAQRQLVDGQPIIVDYALDTDADKARYVKASGPITLDSPTDPFKWVVVSVSPSSATTALDTAWNLLETTYTASSGNFGLLSQALIGWRAADFAGLSFDDQLQFALRASAHGLLGTNLREIEATLRAAGFPMDLVRLLPASGVDLALTSAPTCAVDGSNFSVNGISLKNNRATQSGPVKLDLYAFPQPYLGGGLTNNARLLGTMTLPDPLDPSATVSSTPFNGTLLTNLPNDTYYVALMVSDGGARTDHYSFRDPLQVGPVPGLPVNEQNMPTQLINLSTRVRVESGEGVAIAGFIVSGTVPKNVIVRALGPSLAPLGVSGTLNATSLELYNSASHLLASNTGWTTSADQQAIIASGLPPGDTRESAIIRSLPPGAYTAIVRGVGGQMGVALVETYDLDRSNANARPVNVSTRGRVLGGDNVLIGGFIIGGSRARRVIVRAIGPTLASSGIASYLANPNLALYDSNGNEMYVNDDWQTSDQAAAIAAAMTPDRRSVGGSAPMSLKPKDPRESAIIVTLAPGAYTAIVRGQGSTTGVALVEAYDLE